MARLLLEDVTLLRGRQITAHVRFKGGATRTLTLPLPQRNWEERRTDPAVVVRVDQLLEDHIDEDVAEILNQEGFRTGTGLPFTRVRARGIRERYGLKSHYERRREQGLWTTREMANHLGVSDHTVGKWRERGRLVGVRCEQYRWLYYPPNSATAA